MKKLLLIVGILFVLSNVQVLAQTATPSPSVGPTTSESVTEKLSDQINNLKEKIASRVAQLKLVEKRGFVGTVKEVTGNSLVLTDASGNDRNIDVDEITKFTSSDASSTFGLSDIKQGNIISVIGLYNKDSERLLARFISTYTLPLYLSGTITAVDKTNYTVTLSMEQGKSYLVDIENVTKVNSYDADTTLEKSGFSKVTVGNRAMVIGYPDKKEKNRMTATRLLLFPSLPKDPAIVIAPSAIDTSNGTVTSSGSGKKLTPVTK